MYVYVLVLHYLSTNGNTGDCTVWNLPYYRTSSLFLFGAGLLHRMTCAGIVGMWTVYCEHVMGAVQEKTDIFL